jgi:hypothetical protein
VVRVLAIGPKVRQSSGRRIRSSPVDIIPPMVLHAHISPGRRIKGPLVAAVQRRSLSPPTR